MARPRLSDVSASMPGRVLGPLIATPVLTLRLWHRRINIGLEPGVVRREAEKPFWIA